MSSPSRRHSLFNWRTLLIRRKQEVLRTELSSEFVKIQEIETLEEQQRVLSAGLRCAFAGVRSPRTGVQPISVLSQRFQSRDFLFLSELHVQVLDQRLEEQRRERVDRQTARLREWAHLQLQLEVCRKLQSIQQRLRVRERNLILMEGRGT